MLKSTGFLVRIQCFLDFEEIEACLGSGAAQPNAVWLPPCSGRHSQVVLTCMFCWNMIKWYSSFLYHLMDADKETGGFQHLAHTHISISHINILFISQHHYYRLNHFRIYFMDNEFEKKII
jgi:hypothetical protein